MSETLSLPEDLATLSDADLATFESDALARFDALAASSATEFAVVQAETVEMSTLTNQITAVRAELSNRAETVTQVNDQRAAAAAQRAAFASTPAPVVPAVVPTPAAPLTAAAAATPPK